MRVRRRMTVLAVLSGLVAAGIGAGFGDAAAKGSEAPSLAELALSADNLSPEAMTHVQRTTGKLYLTFPDQTFAWGTATVVTSQSLDMLLTAAHLFVRTGEDGSELRPEAVTFVPGEEYGRAPYQRWSARDWGFPDTFTAGSPDWTQDDLAVVLLNSHGSLHIQQAVGSQGICFNCPREALVHVFGYPGGWEEGASLYTGCRVVADFRGLGLPGQEYQPGDLFGTCREGTPELTPGSSGSGLLTDLDPTTGLGRIMGIMTWGPGDIDRNKRANRSFDPSTPPNNGGTYLSDTAKALYDRYQNA